MRSMSWRRVTSARTATWPSSAATFSTAGSRSARTSFAPPAASRRAHAAPIPRAAPVMRIVRPSSCPIVAPPDRVYIQRSWTRFQRENAHAGVRHRRGRGHRSRRIRGIPQAGVRNDPEIRRTLRRARWLLSAAGGRPAARAHRRDRILKRRAGAALVRLRRISRSEGHSDEDGPHAGLARGRREHLIAVNEEVMLMAFRINHIHLKAPDPRKTADWYVRAFNFKITSDETRVFGDRFVRCQSEDGGMNVNISGARTNERLGPGDASAHHGLEHFGLDRKS